MGTENQKNALIIRRKAQSFAPMDTAQPTHRPLDRTVMMLSVCLVLAVAALFTVRPWRRSQVTWGSDLNGALAQAKKSGKPVFVEVYASWCGPCRRMERDTFTDPQVGNRLAALTPVLVNYDRGTDHALAQKWNATALPSHVLLRADGAVQAIAYGYLEPNELLAWLNRSGG